MSHIFISYAEEDGTVARAVAQGIEAAGYVVWYYERDGVIPGLSYMEQIVQAIEESRAFILILSRHSLDSEHINAEVVCAFEKKKPFIPVRLGVTHEEFQRLQPKWRLPLGDAVSIDVPADRAESILPRVILGIESLTGHAFSTREQHTAPAVERHAGALGSETVSQPASARARELLREAARVDVMRFSVFWWQWIMAAFVLGSSSVMWGFLFSLLVVPAVFAASYLAQLGHDDPIVEGVAGFFFAGIFGGAAGYLAAFTYPQGGFYGFGFGLISGTYLPGMFRKDRRRMSLLYAVVISVTTIAGLLIYLGIGVYQYGVNGGLLSVVDRLWMPLLSGLWAVLCGELIHLSPKMRGH